MSTDIQEPETSSGTGSRNEVETSEAAVVGSADISGETDSEVESGQAQTSLRPLLPSCVKFEIIYF